MVHRRFELAPLIVLLTPLVACSFNATGLGQTAESGEATTQGPATDQTTSGPGPTGEAPTIGSTTFVTTGSSDEVGTSGPVEPGTGTSTGTSTDGSTSTTGDTSTGTGTSTGSGEGTSSGGCEEQDFYKDGDADAHGDPDEVMTACGAAPDGYVAVGDDCDDKDAAVYPGADEVCDQQDNDCDDLVDEFSPSNSDCDDCKMVFNAATDHVYHFCEMERSWKSAKMACEARYAALARDDDKAEHDWLVSKLAIDSGPWYIGASAANKDDKFVWLDGEPVPDPDMRWGIGRPLGGGGTDYLSIVSNGANLADFLLTSSGRWHDLADKDHESFICEGELPP